MGTSVLAPLMVLASIALLGTAEIVWVANMDALRLEESQPFDRLVYTLNATDGTGGSSADIIYGFNSKLGGDISIDTESSFFRINSTTGDVYTYGNLLDYETPASREFKVNLIAKLRDDSAYSYQTSTITLKNINDEKPTFNNNSLTVDIRENFPVDPITGYNVALINISVSDVDGIITPPQQYLEVQVQYCIINGVNEPCTDIFELYSDIRPSSLRYIGNFIIKKPLDYEISNKIQVQLKATDGVTANDVTSDVVVNIIDIQDVPPAWIVLPAIVNIDDGYGVGELYEPILAEDQDTGNRPIFYYFRSGQTVSGILIESVFTIEQLNTTAPARIVNTVPIDLEDESLFRNYETKEVRNEWPLQIMACEIIDEATNTFGTSANNECTQLGTVKIQIADINDNGPQFNQAIYRYEIFEDAQNGRVLDNPRIEIFDRDTDLYNNFFSSLTTPSAEFEVTGATRNPAISVRNSSLIDYDNGPRSYQLTLETRDVEDGSLFDTAQIFIEIKDVNDNRPQFGQDSYIANIPEDSPAGTNVERVTATDLDSGIYGTDGIHYELTGPYSNLFRIDELSGQVTVDQCEQGNRIHGEDPCLDYDIRPRQYDLTVVASDSNNNLQARRDSVSLTVFVLDVNDNAPTVPNYDRQIIEDTRSFVPPLNVTATDRDENSVLQYYIQSQGPGQFWQIQSNTGIITVDKPFGEGIKFKDGLDGRFELNVLVTDGRNEVTSNVLITVIDINDNAPVFFPSSYNESINELTPGGTFILTITATDQDDATSDNGKLEYNLVSGNTGGKFTLDKETGDLSVSAGVELNYDVQNIYQMVAVVNDKGTPQQTAQADITIHILNNNNRIPYLNPLLQQFEVYDNAAIDHYVGSIEMFDSDQDAVLQAFFAEPKSASSDEGFVVDRTAYDYSELFYVTTAGEIFVNASLDSRRTSIVSYAVEVHDITPNPIQKGRGTCIILIKPFNTQPPEFQAFISPIYIDEEQPIGRVIVSLIATDNNGIREYVIIEQPDDFFTISASTGAVSVVNRVDYDDLRYINDSYFIVRAVDTGEPVLTATASVSVIFRNINDNFPDFMDPFTQRAVSVYTSRIEENAAFNRTIGTAYAFDIDRPDSNGFNEVRYSMNDDRFDVDPITGRMYVRLRNGAVLDREQNSRILTQVIATDCPNCPPEQQNQRAASVQVSLTDVNDNPPVFSRREYSVTIFETIGVETDILQLFSSDADIGINAISYYTKVYDPNDRGFFDVRLQSGRIFVKSSLIHHVGTYTFLVQAQDKEGTEFVANATVHVTVKPSANSPPIWVIPPVDNMTIFVLEEQYNGMLVYDVFARDDDTGINGVVDYSFIYNGITQQETPDFKINRVTGVISANIVYDRERVNKYVLLLKAKDRGETPLETTRFLTVIVKDVNDNKPRFSKNSVDFRVKEDAPKDQFVGQVTATDPDEDPIIVYDIISGNEDGTFRLNRDTGTIRLDKGLDRENKAVYYLDIQASNNETDYTVIRYRRKRAVDISIITVKISIGDINDQAPVFLQDQYYGCVSTRSAFDKHILTIQAIDRDAVGTGVVRYQTMAGHKDPTGRVMFDIHEKFGVITNKVLMRQYAGSTFHVTVNARDAVDPIEAESANTTALIFVNTPGNEVKLLIGQNTGEVRLYQSQIQNIIEKPDDLSYVCINDIQDHVIDTVGSVSTLWSDVYVTGIRREFIDGQEKFTILSSTEFKNIISREKDSRPSDFELLYIREVEERSSVEELELEDSAILIMMIIVAVLIFLVIIFCIVAFMCIRMAKQQKKTMLLHRTHETPAPIMVMQQPEPEPVIYDNRAYIQEEPVHVIQEQRIIHEERKVVAAPEPVHVQYAVVQKRAPSPQFEESGRYERVNYVIEDDQDEIVVELKDDEPRGQHDVYDPVDNEYRIETEVVHERM